MRTFTSFSVAAIVLLTTGVSLAGEPDRRRGRDEISPKEFIVGKWYKKSASGIDAAWEFTNDGRVVMKVGRGASWIDYGSENTFRYVGDGRLCVTEKDPTSGAIQRQGWRIRDLTPNAFSL